MLSKELEDLRTKPGVLKKHLDHSLSEMKSKLTDTEEKTKPLTDQLARIEKKRKVLDTMVQPEVTRITPEKYREEIVKLNIQEKDLKERAKLIDPNINSDIEFKRQQIDAFQTFIDGIYSNPDPKYHDDLKGNIEGIDRFVKRAKKTLDNHPTKPHPLDAFIHAFENAGSVIGDGVIGIIATGKDGKAPTVEVRFDGKTSKALVSSG
jgi:chromosome segregation ATPase